MSIYRPLTTGNAPGQCPGYSRCRRAGRINAWLEPIWIKQLDVEVIKLHQGLSRNIEKRSENQLLVQSLVEACKGMPVQVFATGVRKSQ